MSLRHSQHRMIYRIVLIDDVLSALNMLAELPLWEQLGFEVCGKFSTYEDAISYIDSGASIDVVFTDIRLGAHTGLDIVYYAKERMPEISAVLISAYSEFEYAHQAIDLGVVGYLQKPITYSKILECFTKLREHLDKQRRIQEQLDAISEDRMIAEISARLQRGENNAAIECFHIGSKFFSSHDPMEMRNFIERLLSELISNELLDSTPVQNLLERLPELPNDEMANELSALLSQIVVKRSSYETVALVKQYVKRNLADNLLLNNVASYVGFHPNYLSSLFHKSTGESFVSYVLRARLDLAKRLLVDPSVKISEIHIKVGYQNRKWFNKVFFEATGVTPRDYRLAHLGQSQLSDHASDES